MKTWIATLLLAIGCGQALADDCDARAAEKKLAGAAKNSFLKKCNADQNMAACEARAKDKSLAGAAKNSFMKKCVADAAAAK